MRYGAVFPQTEIGNDPLAIRDFAQTVEGAGFDHLVAYDHVLGAVRERFVGAPRQPYTVDDPFHEVFVLLAYLGAVTQRIELGTSVLVLPQRQTALVAKQTAAIDVLTGGRVRLGIGVGWNFVEYEALDEDFHNRGRRSAEQIEVMRRLWTEPVVNFHGEWHHIEGAGINPLPVQRPIPIWIGGSAEPVLRRIGESADGWFVSMGSDEIISERIERVRGYMREAGRNPDDLGIEGRMSITIGGASEWAARADAWRGLGATHISVTTTAAGFTSPKQHLDALLQWKETVQERLGV